MKEFICTTNTWYEVESLGRRVHHETESIYYETHKAETVAKAKTMFLNNQAVLCEYRDIRCRLSKNVDLF